MHVTSRHVSGIRAASAFGPAFINISLQSIEWSDFDFVSSARLLPRLQKGHPKPTAGYYNE
jgi:hypothetical protein